MVMPTISEAKKGAKQLSQDLLQEAMRRILSKEERLIVDIDSAREDKQEGAVIFDVYYATAQMKSIEDIPADERFPLSLAVLKDNGKLRFFQQVKYIPPEEA